MASNSTRRASASQLSTNISCSFSCSYCLRFESDREHAHTRTMPKRAEHLLYYSTSTVVQ